MPRSACLLLGALALAGCSPPPTAWPIAGTRPQPDGDASVLGHAGLATSLPEPDDVSAAGGVVGRYQLSPIASVGAGLVVMDGPVYAARADGRLHLFEGAFAPGLGLGGGSSFDGLDYVAADLSAPLGHAFGGWEIYGGPVLGISLAVGEPDFQPDTLFVGGMAGGLWRVAAEWDVGIEAGAATVHPDGAAQDLYWYGGAGAFVRYRIGGASSAPQGTRGASAASARRPVSGASRARWPRLRALRRGRSGTGSHAARSVPRADARRRRRRHARRA